MRKLKMTLPSNAGAGMRTIRRESGKGRTPYWILTLTLLGCLSYQPYADAGSVFRTASNAAITRIFRQDLKNHSAAQVKPLSQARTVHRYSSSARAASETRLGLAPDTHMTSWARPGRPLSAINAQRRYGLPTTPQVRETIHLPRGTPVRHNKVVAGAPGVGEITSPRVIPAQHIRRVVPLP